MAQLLSIKQGQEPRLAAFKRSLRNGFRMTWDTLGFVCAASLAIFAGAGLTLIGSLSLEVYLGVAWQLRLLVSLLPTAVVYGLLFSAACMTAARQMRHEEIGLGQYMEDVAGIWRQSAALGTVQALVFAILAVCGQFYTGRHSFLGTSGVVFCLYTAMFWGCCCIYQFPLLACGTLGEITRTGGGGPRVFAAVRNSAVLVISAPGFSAIWLFTLAVLLVGCSVSGLGLAMVWGGGAALLATSATRERLMGLGVLPREVDPDEPVLDTGFNLRQP